MYKKKGENPFLHKRTLSHIFFTLLQNFVFQLWYVWFLASCQLSHVVMKSTKYIKEEGPILFKCSKIMKYESYHFIPGEFETQLLHYSYHFIFSFYFQHNIRSYMADTHFLKTNQPLGKNTRIFYYNLHIFAFHRPALSTWLFE